MPKRTCYEASHDAAFSSLPPKFEHGDVLYVLALYIPCVSGKEALSVEECNRRIFWNDIRTADCFGYNKL